MASPGYPRAALSGFPEPPPLQNFPRSPQKLSSAEHAKWLSHMYEQPLQKILKRNQSFEEQVKASLAQTMARPQRKGELSEKEQKMIDSLYTQAVKTRQMKQSQLERKFMTPGPNCKKMKEEEQEEVMSRLYSSCMANKAKAMKEAEQRVYGVPAEPKKLSAEELKEAVDKLFTKSLERKKAELERIEESYGFKPRPSRKLQADQMSAVVNRLSGKS
eukprot:RCo009087